MRTENLLNIGIVFAIFLIFFLLIFGAPPAQGQSFDQKFTVTWLYVGSNSDVLFLLYHSPTGQDSTFFVHRKPVFSTQSILETGNFVLKLNIYQPNHWGARNCVISGRDSIFSKWEYATFQHLPSSPQDLKFYLR